MNTFHDLSESEIRGLAGGADPSTAITQDSSIGHDLGYLAGYVVGSIAGFFAMMSAAEPYSVTAWKTGSVATN